MFATLKLKIILALYIFLIVSIPVGAYLASSLQSKNVRTKATENAATKKQQTITKTAPATPSAQKLSELVSQKLATSATPKPTSTQEPSSPQIATSFGPTLSGKITLEGRPKDNQATRLFVGIVEGIISQNPKFILSFAVDVPTSGEFGNLSLAGLTTGGSYSALLKGSTQIATSSAFTLSPTQTKLNGGNPILNLSGDLNEDNVVNSSDYSIVKAQLGTNSSSKNWNDNADFNKDGVINIIDLAIVSKNLGKVGASGAWTSPIPKVATSSGGLTEEATQSATGGYWIWIPR